MAKFHVNPEALLSVSDEANKEYKRIMALTNEIEGIKNSLSFSVSGNVQITKKLKTIVEDSKTNGTSMKQISSVSSKVAELYKKSEKKIYSNADGVADEKGNDSKKSFFDSLSEFLVDFSGKMGPGGKIISEILKVLTGAKMGEGAAKWAGLIKDAFGITNGIASFIGKDKSEQTLAVFLGAITKHKSFKEGLISELNKYKFVSAEEAKKLTGTQVVARNTATVTKWLGTAMTFVTEGIENYKDNKDSADKNRWIKETVVESGINIAEDILLGAAIGSVIPGAGTLVGAAIAGGTVIAKWGINEASKALTGKKFDEAVSDLIIDGAEAIGNAVESGAKAIGKGAKQVGKAVSSWWNGVTNWGKTAFA